MDKNRFLLFRLIAYNSINVACDIYEVTSWYVTTMRLPKFDCAILVITCLKILVYCVCFENNYKCELSLCEYLGSPSFL